MTKATKTAAALIVGAAAIQKAITSIATRGAKLDADIQHAGLSVLAHIQAHGDYTLAERLVTAMPKGARKLALVEWMLAFGQVRKLEKGATDNAAIAEGHIFAYDKARKTNMEGAAAMPWTEFKKEADVLTAFDAQAAVAAVLKRLSAASKGGLTIEHREEALTEARALVLALTDAPAVSDAPASPI